MWNCCVTNFLYLKYKTLLEIVLLKKKITGIWKKSQGFQFRVPHTGERVFVQQQSPDLLSLNSGINGTPCCFLLSIVLYISINKVCVCFVTQPCPTLCYPMDCSSLGSSAYGILQARMLEWWSNPSLLHRRQILYHLSNQGSPKKAWLSLN